ARFKPAPMRPDGPLSGRDESRHSCRESYHDDVPRLGTAHRYNRNRAVKGHQSAFVLHSECKKINVGKLLRPQNPRSIDMLRVEQRDVVGPEGMKACTCCSLQQIEGTVYGGRPRIFRLRQDSYEPVLRQGTRCPALSLVRFPPLMRLPVMDVVGLKQRNQQVDVE